MDIYLVLLFAAGLLLIVGGSLIGLHHKLRRKRDMEMVLWLTDEVIPDAKKTILRTLTEGMDMIPEKIAETKAKIESGM